MLKQSKKFERLILTSALKPKAFLILFSLFFSSLAFAAALIVTFDGDSRIPPGDANCFSSDLGSGTHQLNKDRTQDPMDVAFSEDGSKVFTVNTRQFDSLNLNMNTLSIGFELNAVDTSDELGANNNGKGCDALDAFDHRDVDGVSAGSALNNIKIVHGGKIFFLLTGQQGSASHNRSGYGGQPAELLKYDLSVPNDFTTASFDREHDFSTSIGSVAFSRDGTKLFALEDTADTPNLTTFSLPGPFDISSLTQIHTVDLSSAYDFMNEDGEADKNAVDIEFSNDGSAMFVMMNNDNKLDGAGPAKDRSLSFIYQFSLSSNYDVSSATLVGKWNIVFDSTSNGFGMPQGFTFSSDGMKMFIVQIQSGAGVDRINSYSLECPYGLIACVSNSRASIVSQVELAKQNISLNIDTIFKRFEWIKRNRDNEELSSHNININYPNPLLKSLASKFEPSLKNNLATLVSNTKKKEKKKKSKWSSWSIVDISIGNYEKTPIDKPKDILTKGLTLGSDRKIGDDKFFGLALRYGNSESDIRKSVQEVDLESLTLNIYGVVPTSNTQYINAVLGLSALRFDNKYLQAISGERNGKQAFASINYRSKNVYSKFNITPTGKLTYGVTQLSEFTDFLSNTTDGPTTDRRYAKDTFESGEFAGGLLFEMEKYESEQGSLQPMGGIEIIYDITDDITYKYQNVGATAVGKETIKGKYSRQNLKTNIGFEAIHTNGFTVSTDYQRTIRLNDKSAAPTFTTERFIIKFSKTKEDDTQFAFDFDPLMNNFANLSYAKDIGNFNLKFNSNYSSIDRISDYGANIELSGTF